MIVSDRVAPRHLVDHLLAAGRSVVTVSEVQELTGLSAGAAVAALTRLRRDGLLFSPTRGLYVMIEPRYRSWGAVPAVDFIDPLMRALGRGYYVSLLSAAELYGASHQRPAVFQVMVDRQVGDRDFGRVRLRFHLSSRLGAVPTILRNSATGQFHAAAPATVCLDLATRPNDAGGLDNVATVLSELVSQTSLQAQELVGAAVAYPVASLRRLGWLLELVESQIDLEVLRQGLSGPAPEASRSTTLLDPAGRRHGRINTAWRVIENCPVEPDL
jgi:predicted transcriptional regulator of viral defense system